MSDTPRTDRAQFAAIPDAGRGSRFVVEADFARTLERELAEALVDVERYRIRRKQVFDMRNRLQVSGPRATWEEFCKEYDENKPHHEVG